MGAEFLDPETRNQKPCSVFLLLCKLIRIVSRSFVFYRAEKGSHKALMVVETLLSPPGVLLLLVPISRSLAVDANFERTVSGNPLSEKKIRQTA